MATNQGLEQFLHCSRPWLLHLLEATLRLHPVAKHRHGFLDPERVRSWTKGTERPKFSGICQLLYWWPDLDSWPVLWAVCPSSGFLFHLSCVSTYLFNQDSHIIPAQKSGQLWFWPAVAQGYFLAGRPLPGRPRLVLPFPGESVYEGPACSSWASSALREQTCCRSRHPPVSHTAPSAETKQKVPEPKGSASYESVCSLRAKKWVLCVSGGGCRRGSWKPGKTGDPREAEWTRLQLFRWNCCCCCFNLFIHLFNFWPCWVFAAACGFSLVTESGGYSLLPCVGFSLLWLLLLQSTGSRCAGFSSCGLRGLERRLSSCGARA